MTHFFVKNEQVNGDTAYITGGDFNHLKNVLRMRAGEKLQIADENSFVYTCEITGFSEDAAELQILNREEGGAELSAEITLFQGLPKSDKLELIIQKAVELGASRIVPVEMKRSIAKIDPKKEESKIKRFQAIAESAAKQSGRNRIPEVTKVMRLKDAVAFAKDFDLVVVPYECAEDMNHSREIVKNLPRNGRIGIFIGPEGGFEVSEVEEIEAAGGKRMTLGRRILRTETAGLMLLSVLMFELD